MHTAGPGIWRETLKIKENEVHMVGPVMLQKTLKNLENEKCTL